MIQPVYVNLPVKNVGRAEEFYAHLGFKKNPEFSTEQAVAMAWNDHFVLMLLDHAFFSEFIDRPIADAMNSVGCLVSLSFDSREEVDAFAQKAKEKGGRFYQAEIMKQFDFMYNLEIVDPEGHQIEAGYMDMSKAPS